MKLLDTFIFGLVSVCLVLLLSGRVYAQSVSDNSIDVNDVYDGLDNKKNIEEDANANSSDNDETFSLDSSKGEQLDNISSMSDECILAYYSLSLKYHTVEVVLLTVIAGFLLAGLLVEWFTR